MFLPVFALTGTMAAKSRVFDRRSRNGMSADACLTRSTLFTAATIRCAAGISSSTARSSGPKRSASTTKSATSASRAASVARRFSRRCRLLLARLWRPGASTKMYWQSGPREDAGDQVARGLRLGRDDRDLLADQAVQQARLAGVRAPRNADRAAAVRAHCKSLSSLSNRLRRVLLGALARRALCLRRAHPRRRTPPRTIARAARRGWRSRGTAAPACRARASAPAGGSSRPFSTLAGSTASSSGPSACTTARRAAGSRRRGKWRR